MDIIQELNRLIKYTNDKINRNDKETKDEILMLRKELQNLIDRKEFILRNNPPVQNVKSPPSVLDANVKK